MDEIDLSQINPGEPQKKDAYLGDLSKTQILYDLIKVPKQDRDSHWKQLFLSNLPLASLRSGETQVVRGPDGFPYFQLFLPEPGKEFQAFVLHNMKDDFLLEKGIGVVINPVDNQADWVFSYGDVLHYHLKNTLEYSKELPKSQGNETLQADEKVMVSAPSEEIFPEVSRKLLNELLKMNGLAEPKILLMKREKEGVSKQHFAFNITPQTFEDENKYQGVMQALSWYLPRDYSIIGLDEKQFEKGFQPLF